MIFKFDNKFNMEMEGDTNMGKKNKGNSNPVIDINAIKDEIFNSNKVAQEETAVGFESTSAEDNWEEPQKADDQMSKEEFNSDYNELQKKNEEEERLKQRLRMQNIPSLSNKTKKEENEFEFEKCYPINRFGKIHKWQTSMSADKISELYKSGQIYYDFDIQRGFKTNIKGEKKPLITSRHVDDILKPMQSNTIAGGALTFCYFKEYDEELEYDESINTLTFHNKLAIIDGGHRVFSCIKMKRLNKKDLSNPDPKLFEYPVFIEYMTKSQAMALFSEYANAGKKIGKVRVEALNVNDMSHDIAEEIIKTSELHNKVERVSSSPKDNNIMLFSTLMNGIRIFKPLTNRDSEEISNFLSEFWSEVIYLFKDQMGNMDYKSRKEIRKQTFLLEPMFLNGMFHVAKTLYENHPNDWLDKLKNLKEANDFFSRDNKQWLPIMREGGATINTSLTQRIVVDIMIDKVMSI